MNEIVAFIDEVDQMLFETLLQKYKIYLCTDTESFSKAVRADALNIYSARLVQTYYKELEEIVATNKDIVFRMFQVGKHEQYLGLAFGFDALNLVRHMYSIEDVENELSGKAALKYYKETDPEIMKDFDDPEHCPLLNYYYLDPHYAHGMQIPSLEKHIMFYNKSYIVNICYEGTPEYEKIVKELDKKWKKYFKDLKGKKK